MWHLKTKLGVFWVAPLSEEKDQKMKAAKKYYLGVNDHELGIYTDIEQAAKDVHDQKTGYLKWDIQPKIQAPEHISEWNEGEPLDWSKH